MALGAALVVLAACSGEDATPVDLDSSTTTQHGSGPTSEGGEGSSLPAYDQNAESRQMAVDFAEQQCLDDPEADEGIIRIVDPRTDQVVGEVIVDCVDVRARID